MAGLCRFRCHMCSVARKLGLGQRRSFGAPAVQFDCDSDYEESTDQQPLAGACATISGRGVQWALIGNPGVRKHVCAGRLSKLLEVPYISMGSLVRQELNPGSSLYRMIANAVNEGKLVPEDVVFGLLTRRLEEGCSRGETGFILDGIPRNRIQAERLDQIAEIDLVVNFKCEECTLKKQFGGGGCRRCVNSFAAGTPKPSSQNSQLNPSSTFSDDTRGRKLQFHAEQSKLLEDYYRKRQKLVDVEVAGGPGETWQGLLAALHLQHMDTNDSSAQRLAE